MVRAQWCLIAASLCLLCLQRAYGQDAQCDAGNSLFSKKYNYPYPWWVVYPADVPGVANRALTLRSALVTSEEAFAEQIILGIARNQSQDIAKSIGTIFSSLGHYRLPVLRREGSICRRA